MSRPRPHFFLSALALILLFGACTSLGGKRGRGPLIEVQVVNDLTPPRSVTIEIATAEGGRRAVLGSIGPSRDGHFGYRLPVTGADYVFKATDAGGKEITSRVVALGENDIVVWSLRNNRLELRI